MPRSHSAPLVLLALAFGGSAFCQTPLAPEAGVLALRNGHVIFGQVTRAGDYYVVTSGEGSELRLKSDDVESFCANLREVYELKKRYATGITVRPHVELARWCLRHELIDECREQLSLADEREPGNAQVADLRRRLELTLEAPAAPAPAVAPAQVPLESLEQALADLPKGSIEKFGAIVQPILLNRCGANQCHGPNSHAEFRLLRPPPGQIVSRRFTQRNLYAAIRYLDRADPTASPLIVLPQQRHGTSLAPVFDKHSASQLAELVSWARATAGSSAAAATTPSPASTSPAPRPATIGSQGATHAQAAIAGAGAATLANGALPTDSATVATRVMRPAGTTVDSLPTSAQPKPAGPRDRYDPEIFNQRYHAR